MGSDKSSPRERLRRGDDLARRGDIAGAVREYLTYATWADEAGFALQAVAVYRQVLDLAPERRGVRRRLAEAYAALGLWDDARSELDRFAEEARRAGDEAASDEALARRDSIIFT